MSLVAIVGRPNVGKSTLFNRLVGMRKAIVDDTAGTTRDRHYGRSDWSGREFSLIDTGGYVTGSDDVFEEEIRKQVLLAIDEADVILFLLEVSTGITDLDMVVADLLRRSSKKVIVVVNKVDNNAQQYGVADFYALGLGDPIAISSMSGSGTGEMMDAIVAALPPDEIPQEEELPRITVVGRPNVGKSSLTNALLGEERNIVTPVAGTTRDAIHTRYNKFGMDFLLVDTAGLRKKGKVTEDLEFYSVMRSIRSIESSDVCILMLDAAQGIESQDMNIFSLIVRNKKGCVIVVNKWDLVPEKQNNTMKEWREFIRGKLAPFNDVPIVFTSVTEKQRILDVLQAAVRVDSNRRRKIATSQFNDYMLPIIEATPPPAIKGKYIRIKYAQQLASPTPAFAFFVNLPQYIRDPYRRFLENKIREKWDFEGVPIQIYFRQK